MVILRPLHARAGAVGFAGGVFAACLVFGAVMGVAYEKIKPEHVT